MATITVTLDTFTIESWWGAKSNTANKTRVDKYPNVTGVIPAGSTINSATLSLSYSYVHSARIYSLNGTSLAWYATNVTTLVRDAFSTGNNPLFTFLFQSDAWNYPYAGTNTLTISDFTITIDYTPSVSDGTLDKMTVPMDDSSTITLSIQANSNIYSHKARWRLGNALIVQDVAAGAASTTLTVPLGWCAQLPSATSGTAQVTLETYSGATLMGSKAYSFNVTVPASVVPTVSLTVTPIGGFNGQYLKGITRARLDAGASGAQGSGIAGYQMVGGGYSGNTDPFDTGALMALGAQTMTVTVTDSRGRQATASQQVTVVDYARPIITSPSAIRCTSNGTPSDSGTYAKVVASYSVAAVTGNGVASAIVRYKKADATAWTDGGGIPSGGAGKIIGNGTMAASDTYNIEVAVTDTVGQTSTYALTIGPELAIYDFRHDRAGVGRVAGDAKTFVLPDDWILRAKVDPSMYTHYDNRENLLINSSFELAEENGAVSVPLSQAYGNFRDIWKVWGTGTANFNSGYKWLSQQSGYETITNMYFANRTSDVYLVQPIEELQTGALVRAAQYTASCWIHSEQAVTVTLCGKDHNLPANQWTFIATTFAPYAESSWYWYTNHAGFKLNIPNVSGTGNKFVHVALPMVVRGDKPGTWYHLDEKHEVTREQRYFFRVGDGWIFGENVTGWGHMARYPNIHMRVAPTVIKSATTQIYQPATGWQTVTAASVEQNNSETRVLFNVPNQLAGGPFIINGLWALDARYY